MIRLPGGCLNLWKIDDALEINWLQNIFKKTNYLYIADGHHRCEASALLSEENEDSENISRNHMLSYLISENNVKIYEYNRVIKDLNGLSKTEFLEALSKTFTVENLDQSYSKPIAKHQFGMYLDGQYYQLKLKQENGGFKSELESLDTQILYDKVLSTLLNIHDLRNDERIEYISGKHPIQLLKQKIDDGEFEVGFILFPCDIEEIKVLADNHCIMPPKSTYIEPKFRSGLVIYEL